MEYRHMMEHRHDGKQASSKSYRVLRYRYLTDLVSIGGKFKTER